MNLSEILTTWAVISAVFGVIGMLIYTMRAWREHSFLMALVNYGLLGFIVWGYRPTQFAGLLALIGSSIPQLISRYVATNGIGGTSNIARAFEYQVARMQNQRVIGEMRKQAEHGNKQAHAQINQLKAQLKNSHDSTEQLQMMLDALERNHSIASVVGWYKAWKAANTRNQHQNGNGGGKQKGQHNQGGQQHGQPMHAQYDAQANIDTQPYPQQPMPNYNGNGNGNGNGKGHGASRVNAGNNQYSTNRRPVSPRANGVPAR